MAFHTPNIAAGEGLHTATSYLARRAWNKHILKDLDYLGSLSHLRRLPGASFFRFGNGEFAPKDVISVRLDGQLSLGSTREPIFIY